MSRCAPSRTWLSARHVPVLPVNVTMEDPLDLVSSPRIVQVPSGSPNVADRDVVVVADDGPQWFRLRSLTVRGTAKPIDDRAYRLVPKRIVAWDYGSLREVSTPSGGPAALRAPWSDTEQEDDLEAFQSPNLQAAMRKSRVMILTSRSRLGLPLAVPLWFVVSHDGRIYATTSASSWTARNVAVCPQVAVLLGGEGRDCTDRLLVRGDGRAVRGMPPRAVLAQIAWRYYLQPQFAAVDLSHIGLWWKRIRYYGQSQAAHIVVTPKAATEYQLT